MIFVWNLCVSKTSEAEIFNQRGASTMCIQLIYYIIMYSMNMGVIDAYLCLIDIFKFFILFKNALKKFYG